MSNAELFAEAIDAAITLARAYALWLLLLAVLGSLLLLAVVAAVGWLLRAAWRGLRAALRASQGRRGAPDHRHATAAPHARTGVPRYEEAA